MNILLNIYPGLQIPLMLLYTQIILNHVIPSDQALIKRIHATGGYDTGVEKIETISFFASSWLKEKITLEPTELLVSTV